MKKKRLVKEPVDHIESHLDLLLDHMIKPYVSSPMMG
jgi:hypothetical protein